MLIGKMSRLKTLFGGAGAILLGLFCLYGCGSGSSSDISSGGGAVTVVTPPGPALAAISAFAGAAGTVTVTVATPHALTVGDVVIISGPNTVNGTFTVTATPTATSFSFATATVPLAGETGFWQSAGGLIAGCTPTTTGTAGAITLPSMLTVPGRVSGVAPLAVHFNAVGTTATATARPFHELEYRWSFGDASSGNWGDRSTGSSGTGANTSRNVARGPVAAHVYETPGTYVLNLTVTDGTNTISNSCVQIAVQDPNLVYANANTVCISSTGIPSGGADGCPSGAAGFQLSDFCSAVTTHRGTGKRLLFRGGQTFSCAAGTTVPNNGPWTIGSYGGGLARILSSQATGNVIGIGAGAGIFPADGRLMDLEITTSAPPGNTLISVRGIGNFDKLTLLRLNIHDIGDGPQFLVNLVNVAGNTHVWDQLTIADSTIRTITGGAGTHGLFLFASRLALLGNLIDDTFGGEHLARLDYHNGSVISHNALRNGAAGKETMAIRGTENNPAGPVYQGFVLPSPSPSQYIVISDNDFTLDTPEGVKLGPANSTIQVVIQDVISERNYYRAPVTTACGGGLCADTAIITQANRHTIRNEIVRWDNFKFYTLASVSAATTGMAAGSNVDIYNNTAFSSLNSNAGVVVGAAIRVGASNVNIKNNLIYVPSATSTTYPVFCFPAGSCAGYTGLVESNNSTGSLSGGSNQIRLTSPLFTATPPATLADFKPLAGSYAIAPGGGATVPVWSDFFLVSRPPHHLGAVLP